MTRTEIRALCRKTLGETTAAFWTDTEINTYITSACNDISFRTKCIKGNGYLSTTSCSQNTAAVVANEYVLSTNFTNIYSVLEVYQLREGTDWERLTPTTRRELDVDEPSWRGTVGRTYTDTSGGTVYYNYEAEVGIPTKYYWSREEDILGLHLPPDSDNAGSNYVRVYYAKKHTPMTEDTDTPDVPEPMHIAIADFVAAQGFEHRGWGDKANDKWEKYFSRLNAYMSERLREAEDEDCIMRSYKNI